MKKIDTLVDAVIFDLDGVIVSTDNYHYLAWKKMADKNNIHFNRIINERLRGISRMDSLEIILESSTKKYNHQEKIALANEKNEYYIKYISKLTEQDILPGVMNIIHYLKQNSFKLAIGSSSKNASAIIKQIGLESFFDAIVDGNDIKNSKPAPEVFLVAAEKIDIKPNRCLVIEDADAGIEAAIAAKMQVIGIGAASSNPKTNFSAKDLSKIEISKIASA